MLALARALQCADRGSSRDRLTRGVELGVNRAVDRAVDDAGLEAVVAVAEKYVRGHEDSTEKRGGQEACL